MIADTLSPMESEIYHIITEKYLHHTKDLNLQTIIPFCTQILVPKYTTEQIHQAIFQLIEKRYFIKGSALSRDEVLKNDLRKQILIFIRTNPGCYNRLIRRKLQIGSNEFNWHVTMLEKFGFIKKMQFDRSFGYYENRSYMDHEYDLFLLQNEKVTLILDLLQLGPASLSKIAKELEMHYSTVQKYLEVLEDRKILITNTDQKPILYQANQEILIKLRKIINGAVFIEFAE